MNAIYTAALALPLMLSGCNTEPSACTENIEPGITVRALEAGSRVNVTDGVQGTVAEGTYVDSLRPAQRDAAGRILLLSAAAERPGVYDLFVEHPNYQAVSLSGIQVTPGECHVHTVALDVTMVPIP